MITKFFLKLFVPTRWTIIKERLIEVSKRDSLTFYSGPIPYTKGTQYTLQNQYGEIKFKTIWLDGSEGAF